MVIIETEIFTRQVLQYLTDDEYRELQQDLTDRPDLGQLIPAGGGVRKLRWGLDGRGKRGGARVIYYWAVSEDQIFMLLMYPKNVQDNLTPAQLQVLRRVVEEEYL